MSNDRLIDLETKVAFQEHTLEVLQQTVYEQQKEIAQLEKTLKRLARLVEASGIGTPDIGPADEKPPHY